MPASAFQLPVRSNPEVDFLEGLSTNQASATVSLVLPLRDAFWFLRAITLVAVENHAYELMLFTSADNMGTTFDTDNFLGTWQFNAMVAGPPASPGYPVETDDSPGNGLYHFYIDGNFMPYFDGDMLAARSQAAGGTYPNNAHLHCRLVNRSLIAKSAGAGGAVQVTFFLSVQGQQV